MPHTAAAPVQILSSTKTQFLTDAGGIRTAVVLPIETFQQILTELSSLNGEVAEADWLRAASRSAVFTNLDDPAEDLYSADDGVSFQP